MISLHEHVPVDQPHRLARQWKWPWWEDKELWLPGQTQEWAEPSLERIAQLICQYPWSPSRYWHDHRCEAEFLSSQIIALDFDEGKTLEWAIERFARLKNIIATTKSHQQQKGDKPPCDRFRVILFARQRFFDLEIYKKILRGYVETFDADSACTDGARFFWPCREIISIRDGYCAPEIFAKRQEAPMERDATTQKKSFAPNTSGIKYDPKDPTTWWACRHWRVGGGAHIVGNRNKSCYRAAGDLCEFGWPEEQTIQWLLSCGTTLTPDEVRSCVRGCYKHKRGC